MLRHRSVRDGARVSGAADVRLNWRNPVPSMLAGAWRGPSATCHNHDYFQWLRAQCLTMRRTFDDTSIAFNRSHVFQARRSIQIYRTLTNTIFMLSRSVSLSFQGSFFALPSCTRSICPFRASFSYGLLLPEPKK